MARAHQSSDWCSFRYDRFAAAGVILLSRLQDAASSTLVFADDLRRSEEDDHGTVAEAPREGRAAPA